MGVARLLTASILSAALLFAHVAAQQSTPPPRGGGAAPAPAAPGARAGGPPLPPIVQLLPIAPPRHPIPPEDKSRSVTRFSFIAYGDTRGTAAAEGSAPVAAHLRVVDTMLATIKARARGDYPVRFVLQTGDAVLNGARGEAWNASYKPEVDRITAGADVPYFLTAGNHDVAIGAPGSPTRALGLHNMLAAFSRLIPAEGSPRRLNGYATYAFGYGNVFVIAFDTNLASDQLQLAWVADQLERLDRVRYPHVIAFVHHPPYSSGPHGGATLEPETTAMRALYMPLLRRHHVRLIAAGHEHFFEHWAERYADAGQDYRMDTIVTGGGGAPIYTYRAEPDLRAYVAAAPGQNVRVEHVARPGATIPDNPNHFVVIEVDGGRLTAEVVAAGNAAYTPFQGSARLELTLP
jgi:hypothetical protein